MRLILTCALLASPVLAAPRVALIILGGGGEVARAEVESLGLEVKPVGAFPLAGRLVALGAERELLTVAVDEARQAYIATRFAEVRAIAERAERGSHFRGEPEITRRLAELAVMAALSGDKDGFARAVADLPALKLDAAKWSPDARAGVERAKKERDSLPRVRLTLATPLFVDGVLASGEVELPVGAHWLFALLPGRFHAGERVDLKTAASFQPTTTPADDAEQLALLTLRLAAGMTPTQDELQLVSRTLDVEATLVADASLRRNASAVVAECSLKHSPPERIRAQKNVSLHVEAGPCLSAVHGNFRAGARNLSLEAKVLSGGATLEVPSDLLPASDRPYVLDYRLWGDTFHHARTADSAPQRVLVESAPIPRWYRKWWVWTLVGVAVTAVVVIPSVVAAQHTTDVRLVGN